MKIIIDADACPKGALASCQELGHAFGVDVWTVASFNHSIVSEHHLVVGGGSQEADMKLINITQAGDIVVTQDWGLAAMVLGRKAFCLSPVGREYKEDQMDFLLEEREIKAKIRRGGGRTKGPRKRTTADELYFAASLTSLLQRTAQAASGSEEEKG
jgi:uncharacterized protein YaiI (UPF0178 family)